MLFADIMIHAIDRFCGVPITLRILSRITVHLAMHWKDIGYELIAEHKVANIACSRDDVTEKCFTMLHTWLQTDSNPCYCKLLTVLELYEYHHLLIKVKEIITSSYA